MGDKMGDMMGVMMGDKMGDKNRYMSYEQWEQCHHRVPHIRAAAINIFIGNNELGSRGLLVDSCTFLLVPMSQP